VTNATDLVTKAYTDGQIATRGGLTATNAWTGTNTFSQLPTSSGTVTNATDLVTKAYTDGQIATRGGLTTNNTWTGQNIFDSIEVTARVQNYSSNWTFVESNSEYSFNHDLGWTINNIPFLRILFSPNSSPQLGTHLILEMDVCHTTGVDNNQTNEMYGIFVRHTSGNALIVYTGNDGVYYGKGSVTYNYTTGYIKVIMYR
jgi:hypothetical protein